MNNKHKLLLVNHNMMGRGIERVIVNLLKGFDRSKIQATLVLFDASGPFISEIPSDIEVIDLKKHGRIRYEGLIIVHHLRKLMRIMDPDSVLCFGAMTSLVTSVAHLLSGVSCRLVICHQVATGAANKYLNYISSQAFSLLLIRVLFRRAHTIIATSVGVMNDLNNYFKLPLEIIRVISNPIDVDNIPNEALDKATLPFANEFPIIAAMGSLTKQKGFEILLMAFSFVYKLIPANLIILGEGGQLNELSSLATKLGIREHVFFAGFKEKPFGYLSQATVFVLSSYWEGFANVIVEAMACGVPVVSTDCPSGPGEIITDGVNGLLVKTGDAYSLAQAILRILQNEQLRNQCILEGFKRAKCYNISTIVGEYENILMS